MSKCSKGPRSQDRGHFFFNRFFFSSLFVSQPLETAELSRSLFPNMENDRMLSPYTGRPHHAHHWPEDTYFRSPFVLELDCHRPDGPSCRALDVYLRSPQRHFFTLDGPVRSSPSSITARPCAPGAFQDQSPEIEPTHALPVGASPGRLLFIGHRRFSRHARSPRSVADLHDAFAIVPRGTGAPTPSPLPGDARGKPATRGAAAALSRDGFP